MTEEGISIQDGMYQGREVILILDQKQVIHL